MWILLYIFSSITVHVLCGKLVGDHICLTEESYTVNVTEHYVRNATVRNYQWCLNVPPRCSFYTIKKINDTRIVERTQTRTVEKCCEGFHEQDNECVSFCPNCVNGICNQETCQCSSGYSGKNCDNICQSGFWGPNCTKQCDCEYQLCNPTNGNCIIADENKNEINSKVKDDYNEKTTLKFDLNEAITAKNETIKSIDTDYTYTTEYNKISSNYDSSFTKNDVTTQNSNIVKLVSNYNFIMDTDISTDLTISDQSTSTAKQLITSNNEDVLFLNTTDAMNSNLGYTKMTPKPAFQTHIESNIHFRDNLLNQNKEFFIPVGIKYDQITKPLSQRNTENTTKFANSEENKFLVVDDNNNESHTSTNRNNLINSVSVSIATTVALILLVVVLLTINKNRKAKENRREDINTKKNVGVSTVSIYTTSIFHTPLPDPPTFENPSYLTPAEYQGNANEPRTFQTHVVCNMNRQNQKQDYRDSVYDHPPSTGSYRAASIIEPLDIDHKPPITPVEPVYDEIPCRGIEANPYCNQPLSLYINTCGRTSF